jgi:hypothetical protein
MITTEMFNFKNWWNWFKTESNARLFFTRNVEPEMKQDFSDPLVNFYSDFKISLSHKRSGTTVYDRECNASDQVCANPVSYDPASSCATSFLKDTENFLLDTNFYFDFLPRSYEDIFLLTQMGTINNTSLGYSVPISPDLMVSIVEGLFSKDSIYLSQCSNFTCSLTLFEISLNAISGEFVVTFIHGNQPQTIILSWASSYTFIDATSESFSTITESADFLSSIEARIKQQLATVTEVYDG